MSLDCAASDQVFAGLGGRAGLEKCAVLNVVLFKRALGGEKYKNWWILKPWVLSQMRSLARSGGAEFNDVSHEKTQLLGGTLIIKGGNVIHEYHETRSFDNGNARDLLNAVLGKSTPATPLQAEACEQ